jgi:hypothetical protein
MDVFLSSQFFYFLSLLFLLLAADTYTQTEKEQLALNVSGVEDAKQEKLKEHIWKRGSDTGWTIDIS